MLTGLFSIESDFVPNSEKQTQGLTLMLEEPSDRPIWVADNNGQIIGMCSLQVLISTSQGTRVGLVEDVYVKMNFREQGIGKALLQMAKTWASTNKLTRLQLLCDRENESALDFYHQTGWEQTHLINLRTFL